MSEIDRDRQRQATAVFKLGVKASAAAVHRTLNHMPAYVQAAELGLSRMK